MPPRKRDRAKVRQGTFRKERERISRLPAEQIGAPPPPDDLPPAVCTNYLRLAAELDAQGLASRSDGDVIGLVAQALADTSAYAAVLAHEGPTYSHGGLVRPRPECQLYDSAWKRALMGLRALGLSPAARGTVEPLAPTEPPDAMERLLQAREAGLP